MKSRWALAAGDLHLLLRRLSRLSFIPTEAAVGTGGGAEQGGEAATKLMATEKAGGTNGSRKGVMRCDCPGCWDCREQNGKRPPGRRENASDCSGKSGVKDHWNGQGNLAAAALGLIPGRGGTGAAPPGLPERGILSRGGSRLLPQQRSGLGSPSCALRKPERSAPVQRWGRTGVSLPSPGSAQPRLCRQARLNQTTMGKHSLGVTQVFGWDRPPPSPPVQGP